MQVDVTQGPTVPVGQLTPHGQQADNRDPVSDNMEGQDQHTRLSSDLHTHGHVPPSHIAQAHLCVRVCVYTLSGHLLEPSMYLVCPDASSHFLLTKTAT